MFYFVSLHNVITMYSRWVMVGRTGGPWVLTIGVLRSPHAGVNERAWNGGLTLLKPSLPFPTPPYFYPFNFLKSLVPKSGLEGCL